MAREDQGGTGRQLDHPNQTERKSFSFIPKFQVFSQQLGEHGTLNRKLDRANICPVYEAGRDYLPGPEPTWSQQVACRQRLYKCVTQPCLNFAPCQALAERVPTQAGNRQAGASPCPHFQLRDHGVREMVPELEKMGRACGGQEGYVQLWLFAQVTLNSQFKEGFMNLSYGQPSMVQVTSFLPSVCPYFHLSFPLGSRLNSGARVGCQRAHAAQQSSVPCYLPSLLVHCLSQHLCIFKQSPICVHCYWHAHGAGLTKHCIL